MERPARDTIAAGKFSALTPAKKHKIDMPETLKGFIERVTYHNPANGFAVLRVTVGRADTGQRYTALRKRLQDGVK